jgi:hypothetical protein
MCILAFIAGLFFEDALNYMLRLTHRTNRSKDHNEGLIN